MDIPRVEPLIQPGRNCWRIERARRASVLVDAAAYFDAVAAAMERAERTIFILGWDIHSETLLRPQGGEGAPLRLAAFLDRLTLRRPALRVRILTWDYSPFLVRERELLPHLRFGWKAPRLQFRFASDHPVGAAHHQKIVVVDDEIAFLGGLDLTVARWDDREHLADDERRTLPGGRAYGPFHDAQLAVDGEVARALGELARERWFRATDRRIAGEPRGGDPWPPGLRPTFENVEVALARTEASFGQRPSVREVEALYLDSIASARRCIYIENQYVTSRSICEALCARLAEEDGPEIVVVTPKELSGSFERSTMGVLRAEVFRRLREADWQDRLRILNPLAAGGAPINVHAKLMVVDDRLLRIGSANLTTRSMGLDSECDAAIESHGDPEAAAKILALRDSLIAEHVGAEPDEVSGLVANEGLVSAIDRLRAPSAGEQRTLEDFDCDREVRPLELLPSVSVIDAECGVDEALLRHALPAEAAVSGKRRLARVLAVVLAVLGLCAAWIWTPLSEWADPARLAGLAAPLRSQVAGPFVATAAFTAAALCMVPVTVLIVVMILLFGTWVGLAGALAGSVASAVAGYVLGRILLKDTVDRITGRRLGKVRDKLAEGGFFAVLVVRLVPVAPFMVINLMAGSSRIRLRDFLLGTIAGMAPGIVVLSLASHRVLEAARNPDPWTLAIAAGVVVAIVLLLRWLRGLLERVGGPGGDR